MRIPRDTRTTDGQRLAKGIYIVDVREKSILAAKLSKENSRRIIMALGEAKE